MKDSQNKTQEHSHDSIDHIEYDPELGKGWYSAFLSRTRVILLILAAIFVAGFLALKTLPLESNPEVKIGKAVVSVAYPGAPPETVEDLITKPVEKEIARVKGVDTYESTIRNGVSSTVVTFKSNADAADVTRTMKDQVDLAAADFPEDAKDPVVKEISFSDQPIWVMAVSGDMDSITLGDYADRIADELEKVPGVQDVQITGADKLEYQIHINPIALSSFGLSLESVNTALKSKNINLPLDSVNTSDGEHAITIDERIYTVDEILNLPLTQLTNPTTNSQGIIRIKDIATVRALAADRSTISRFAPQTKSGGLAPTTNSVQLSIIKRSGGSILDLVDLGNKKIEEMRANGRIPSSLVIRTIQDNSERIRLDLKQLTHDGLITVTIVILVHFAVIGVIEAFVAGLAVPIVFFITFVVMAFAGQTLNFLSMFALILSLGLLVDDAIVVITAINQYKRSGKFTTKEAILLVIRDFKRVLISTTLTVVWIFSAMLFMTGLIRKFIFSIPFILTVTLLASLVIALTLNPALSLFFASLEGQNFDVKLRGYLAKFPFHFQSDSILRKILASIKLFLFTFILPIIPIGWITYGFLKIWLKVYPYLSKGLYSLHPLEEFYGRLLASILSSTIKSRCLLMGVLTLFILACFLPASGLLKSDFFPKSDQALMTVNIEAPAGTPLETTSEIVRTIESQLQKEKEVASISTAVGQLSDLSTGESRQGGQYATVTINLVKKEYGRKESSISIADRLRQEFASFSGATISVSELSGGPPAGADFSLRIASEDSDTLDTVSEDVIKLVRSIPGAVNVRSSNVALPSEFRLEFDPSALANYQLSVSQAAMLLRNATAGSEIFKIKQTQKEIPVITRYMTGYTSSLESILSLNIQNKSGVNIPVSAIARFTPTPALASIERYNGKRVINVTASADKSTNGTEIQAAFQQKLKSYQLPSNAEFLYGGANEENAKSVASLGIAMLFGLLLIVATLVLLFDSYKLSALVLVTIPLSLIGVFVGLTLFRQPLSFPGMIGLVALFGIVVRNGIILFDKINQNGSIGMQINQAIVDAGRTRLEPVLLTSVCTILGMVPLSLSNPTWTPLALSIIFGLTASTLLTLLILPVLYSKVVKDSES